MVLKLFFGCILFLTLPLEANVIKLTPQEVAQKVVSQSYRGRESNITAELARLAYIQELRNFDWTVNLESGRLDSRFESLQGSSFASAERSLRSTLAVQKNWFTGTTLTLDFSQASIEYDLLPSATQNSVNNNWVTTIGFQQSLWRNYFGQTWRSQLESQEKLYDSTRMQRLEDLENLVLQGIRHYWEVVTAKASYDEAVQTRNRYRTLLSNVRRRQSMGFANPGELAQVQAELEGREQGIFRSELQYKQAKEVLMTFLAIDTEYTDIELEVAGNMVVKPPDFSDFDLEQTRPMKIASARLESATAAQLGAKANIGPEVSLVARAGVAGVDVDSEKARQEWMSMDRPQTYVGINLMWEFGSDWRRETERNRALSKEQETLRLMRTLREIRDRQSHLKRQVQSTFEITQSLLKQKEFRAQAVNELTRSYELGRIEIRSLIETINGAFGTEIEYLRSLGEYQTALAELLALRDELIVRVTGNP